MGIICKWPLDGSQKRNVACNTGTAIGLYSLSHKSLWAVCVYLVCGCPTPKICSTFDPQPFKVEGTVNVISSEPPCKDVNARDLQQRYPWNPNLIINVKDTVAILTRTVFNPDIFSIACHKYREIVKVFKGTFVNRALSSLNGRLCKILLTAPLTSNLCLFATFCRRPFVFWTINYVRT